MSTSRYQTGLAGSYNYGSVADVQAGGGLMDSLRRANKFAKDYRLVSRLKGASDALGATEFIDKKTGGLYSKGANTAINKGYGKKGKSKKSKKSKK